MHLVRTLRESIYSPRFYSGLKDKKLSFSLHYYFSLATALSVAVSVVYSVRFIPVVQTINGAASVALTNGIPDNFEFSIKNNIASVNQPEPFMVEFPSSTRGARADFPRYLAVIDTRENMEAGEEILKDALFIITRTSLIINSGGMREASKYSDIVGEDITFTKKDILQAVGQLDTMRSLIVPLVVFGAFFIALIAFLFLLLYTVGGALFVMLVGRLKGIKLPYDRAYRIGVHAMSPVAIIYALKILILPGAPFSLSTYFLAIVIAESALNIRKDQAVLVAPPDVPPVEQTLS